MSWAEVMKSLNKHKDKALNEIIDESRDTVVDAINFAPEIIATSVACKNAATHTVFSITGKGVITGLCLFAQTASARNTAIVTLTVDGVDILKLSQTYNGGTAISIYVGASKFMFGNVSIFNNYSFTWSNNYVLSPLGTTLTGQALFHLCESGIPFNDSVVVSIQSGSVKNSYINYYLMD